MQSAVAEARRRWPEFMAAFQTRDGELFSVKAPVRGGGNTEFIWIQVESCEGQQIRGTIGNDPVDLGGLKEGDAVAASAEEINDWAFLREGQPVGMFTVKVSTGKDAAIAKASLRVHGPAGWLQVQPVPVIETAVNSGGNAVVTVTGASVGPLPEFVMLML